MSYASALSAIVIAVAISAFAAAVACRKIEIGLRRQHQYIGSVVSLQLGIVFAMLLALVLSKAWTEYNEAAKAIDLEVSAMHGISILAAALPPDEASPILSAEQGYLRSVVDDEWRIMARSRVEGAETDQKLWALSYELAHLRAAESDQRDTKGAMLSLLAQAHTQRATRIYQARNGIPGPLWGVLIGFTILLTLLVSLSSIQNTTLTIAITACFTISAASILITARLLDFPFEGALALQPTDFVELENKVEASRFFANFGRF